MLLDQSQWLAALVDPGVQVDVDLVGYPSPMRQPGSWDTGWRTIDEHLIYHLLGDPCAVMTGEGCSSESAGTWIWIPPGCRFRFTLADPGGMALFQRFRLGLVRCRQALTATTGPLILREAWSLSENMNAVVQEADQDDVHAESRRRARLSLLFSEAFRLADHHAAAGPVLSLAQRMHLRLQVRRHLPAWLTPADLAAELGLSADYFARVFRRTFGYPPRTWLMQERIHCAAASLGESTGTISAIASAHGYADLTLFGRQFARVMGSSPRAWRERHRIIG